MSDHISHLADAKNPMYTACKSAWQGWQAPEELTAKDPRAQTLPPHQEPRPHLDHVRQCQACRSLMLNA